MPRTFKNDLTGKVFSLLTVLEFVPDDSDYSKWRVRCACGTVKTVMGQSLIRGMTISCGCEGLRRRAARTVTHGQAGPKRRTRAYRIWANMMDRCEWGGNARSFADYGAKGIRVCERWHKFENFFEDMGNPPDGMSLDRVNNKGGYEPGNCRWATRLQQALNTSRTVKVVFGGVVREVHFLCAELGISRGALRSRAMRRGGNYAEALRSMGFAATEAGAA
ncbi:hypothetical protein C7416_104461 [Cupriavidus phytorum]|uniref:HNH endonuclease n=1 Tax=Cupriavidus phytorum TaxID=3024399 RepID=A0A2W7P2C2_9BURK|nr:hypothetical protein C7416_104461 [Cupriavidus alkaliphilus]